MITARRTTESEVRLAHIADRMWLMARDVQRVDGVPLDLSPVMPTSTSNPATEAEILGRMRDAIVDNAKWNIAAA